MITLKDEETIVNDYKNGEIIIRLSIRYNISDYKITKILKKHNVEIRPRGPKRKD